MKSEIVIIGAGALGKCLAALLTDHAVITLYERDRAVSRALMKGWFIFEGENQRRMVKIRAISSLNQLRGVKIDALIFATKVRDLKAAVKKASGLRPKYVFFPQNGLFDIDWTKRYFKTTRICRGVTTMACQEIKPNHVILFYRGNIYVGGDGARSIADLFRKAGIGTRAYRDPIGCIWAKLIFSAVMNPLPVITGQGYEVLKDAETWKLVQDAVEEGRRVAKALRVRLAFDPLSLIDRVRRGDLVGIQHPGSMFQDLSTGRLTELDFITGASIRQARKLHIKTPALDMIFKRARLAGA